MNILQQSALSLIALSFVAACSSTNDFDTVCSYFEQLEETARVKTLSSDEKFTFINELINKNMPTENPAKESWNAVVGYLPPEGRYAIYKDAAESTLERSWQCTSMETLLKDI